VHDFILNISLTRNGAYQCCGSVSTLLFTVMPVYTLIIFLVSVIYCRSQNLQFVGVFRNFLEKVYCRHLVKMDTDPNPDLARIRIRQNDAVLTGSGSSTYYVNQADVRNDL
jgi:hypothetical protein